MKLTNLKNEEREGSCLRCAFHFKAKHYGLSNSTHLCNRDTKVEFLTVTNHNGHVREKGSTVSGVQTCEQASKGLARCRSFKQK